MKTLEDLKAFSLDKKQMNETIGGYTPCELLVIQGNKANYSDKDWDHWADLMIANDCA